MEKSLSELLRLYLSTVEAELQDEMEKLNGILKEAQGTESLYLSFLRLLFYFQEYSRQSFYSLY